MTAQGFPRDPGPLPEQEPRNYSGWLVLALLIGLILLSLVAQPADKAAAASDWSDAEMNLKQALIAKHSPPTLAGVSSVMSGSQNPNEILTNVENTVAPARTKSIEAAEIYVAAKTESGAKLTDADLAPLKQSKNPIDQNAAVLYGAPKLDAKTAERLTAGFESRGFIGTLMMAQAFSKAGVPGPMQSLAKEATAKFGMIATAITVILSGSLVAWVWVLSLWSSGKLKPMGFSLILHTPLDADRAAYRASTLLALFLGADLLVGLATLHLKEAAAIQQILIGITMLVGVPFVFRFQTLGKWITLESVGLTTQNLARNVSLGLVAFFLEIPVAWTFAVVGSALFSRFHQATHPATQELMHSPSALTILSVAFMACIAAPFWEETMFRGLLFPAFSKVTKSPIWGAVISSFIFGAIHPQGLPLWLALMGLAVMSCAMSYHTRSIVPSIVMHGVHNCITLLMALALS